MITTLPALLWPWLFSKSISALLCRRLWFAAFGQVIIRRNHFIPLGSGLSGQAPRYLMGKIISMINMKKIAPFDTKIVKRGYQEIIDNSNSIRRENKVRQKTFLTNLTQKKFLFRCRIGLSWIALKDTDVFLELASSRFHPVPKIWPVCWNPNILAWLHFLAGMKHWLLLWPRRTKFPLGEGRERAQNLYEDGSNSDS